MAFYRTRAVGFLADRFYQTGHRDRADSPDRSRRPIQPIRPANHLSTARSTVRQELFGLLRAHAFRSFMTEAAETVDIDPDQISFTRTLHIIGRRITDPAGLSPLNPENTSKITSPMQQNASTIEGHAPIPGVNKKEPAHPPHP